MAVDQVQAVAVPRDADGCHPGLRPDGEQVVDDLGDGFPDQVRVTFVVARGGVLHGHHATSAAGPALGEVEQRRLDHRPADIDPEDRRHRVWTSRPCTVRVRAAATSARSSRCQTLRP